MLLQCTVLAVIALETVHSIMVMHAAYYYSIFGACDSSAALEIVWSVVSGLR